MSSQVETRTIPAGGGRELCVELAGEPGGTPILVHPGEPMSRRLYGGWIADAETKGIRLISYDRPGYGGSTAHPGHDVASAAQDVLVIAETFGHDRLGIWGISGGGPYSLGCAALLPDLAPAVADDGTAFLADWGFDLADIRLPVKVWHGHHDQFVPVQHGQWLAANIPGAQADISDRDGHITMLGRIGEIHDWLLQHF